MRHSTQTDEFVMSSVSEYCHSAGLNSSRMHTLEINKVGGIFDGFIYCIFFFKTFFHSPLGGGVGRLPGM